METQNTAARKHPVANFEAMVDRLYNTSNVEVRLNETLEGVIAGHFAQMGTHANDWKRNTFKRLLLHMYKRKCYGVLRNPGFVAVMANMSAFGTKMLRPVEDWVKDSLTAEGQLASMIRHCFAKYEVPEFLEYVFADGNIVHMFWYIQLGRGESIQKLSGLTVTFTKRMAHEFRDTPKHFSVEQAIRRAQALGFGASPSTAEAVAWAPAFADIHDAAFRTAVIRFVAKVSTTPPFDELQKAVEYLAAMLTANPAFSMKGRTWNSVSRSAAAYHADLAKRRAAENFSDWERSTVNDYEVETESGIFRIVQLDTSEALYEEGSNMEHCVAEYAHDCAEGTCAIFSLRRFTAGDEHFDTLATIEIRPQTGLIVQAKARFNDDISAEAHDMIMEWAKIEKLTADYEYYEREAYVQPPVPVPPPAQPRVPVPPPYMEPMHDGHAPYRVMDYSLSTGEIVKIILFVIKLTVLMAKFR